MSACLCECLPCVCRCLGKSEDVGDPPGVGVKVSGPSHRGAGNRTRVLKERQDALSH